MKMTNRLRFMSGAGGSFTLALMCLVGFAAAVTPIQADSGSRLALEFRQDGSSPSGGGLFAEGLVRDVVEFYRSWTEGTQRLSFKYLVDNKTPLAEATRSEQEGAVISLTGGMLDLFDFRDSIRSDAFSLLLCHEVGHFLGGAPKIIRGQSDRRSWSSVEGQSDYFAVGKCLKSLLREWERRGERHQDVVARASNEDQVLLSSLCEGPACARLALAGKELATVFAQMQGERRKPELSKRDASVVMKTKSAHPSAQCRLDTFLAAARCSVDIDQRGDDRDASIGACVASGPFSDGARPSCWYSESAY